MFIQCNDSIGFVHRVSSGLLHLTTKYILVSLTWPSRQLSLYGWRHPGAREAQSTKDIPIQLITLIINSLLR